MKEAEEKLLFEEHPDFKPLDHCRDHCDLVGNIHDDDYYKLEHEQYVNDRVYPRLDLAKESDIGSSKEDQDKH